MTDPVAEVEELVERIIVEHRVLWGCDDPVCAVRSSNFICEPIAAREVGKPDRRTSKRIGRRRDDKRRAALRR